MTALFSKVAAVWTWWCLNLEALAANDDAIPVPRSVFATSPMWWGELLNPPEEE